MRRLIFTGTVICFILAFSNVIIAADIFNAAEQGLLDTVKTLIESNPQLINISDEGGYTPLHKAAYNNQVEVVEYLISKGADLNAVSSSGSTPMHGAAFYGHPEAARVLIENGAEIDKKNNGGYTPFLGACAGGRLNLAALLLENKADINAQTADSNTALHNALWNDNGDLVKLLIENGIDLNIPDQQGISPVYFAVAHRSKEIASLLIDGATDFSGIDDFQLTMLHYAAARGFDDLVRKLVVDGLDINAKCINGKTPLYYASLWGQNNIMDYLKENGAKEEPTQLSQFTGEYLGQKKPGKIPEVFAENALLTPFAPHGTLVFSPDGNEMIWCHQAMPIQAMWYMTRDNGVWQRPVIAPFTDPELDYADGSPCFSQDGMRIYYHSHRPSVEGGEREEDSNIWYVEKTGGGWGKPINMRSPVNGEREEYGPFICESGNLYFIRAEYEDSFGASDVYVSELIDGKYSDPKNLGNSVNGQSHELTPAVAPDESYIIFASNRPFFFGQDLNLYVSYRKADGSWTEAVDLGRMVNSGQGWHPSISPDGEYIFYLQDDQYKWFSSEVVEELKEAMIGTVPHEVRSIAGVSLRKSEQYFDPAKTSHIVMGDLDSDGDPDAVFSNMAFNDSRVWLNDGGGNFSPIEPPLTQLGHGVDLGDLDADGDLDIFITCAGYGENNIWHHRPSKIYFNDGKANFTDSGQNLGDSLLSGNGITLHDVDTDGDLDATIFYYQEPNLIYLNDGSGNFSKSDLTFPDGSSWVDLDSDGDVDLLVREIGVGFKSMLNDGKGNFKEYWQLIDSATVRGRCCFADLDKDGDLDAIIASGGNEYSRSSLIWYNDGTGRFTDSGQRLPVTRWSRMDSADLNDDGHIDIFISNFGLPNYIWLNDGKGNLYDSGLRLGDPAHTASVSLIDLDGDEDLDVFLSNFGDGPNEIWINE